MLILSLLEARPRHGYEIGKLIEARSGGRLTFALPTLYPTLLRLENRGWIKGRWVEKAGQRERCFYRLTPKAAACWPNSRRPGRPTSRRSTTSWGRAVRDWTAFVRARLRCPISTPERESRIVRELAAQLEDFYRDALARGASDAEADAARLPPDPRLGSPGRRTCGADRRHARPRYERTSSRDSNARHRQARTQPRQRGGRS